MSNEPCDFRGRSRTDPENHLPMQMPHMHDMSVQKQAWSLCFTLLGCTSVASDEGASSGAADDLSPTMLAAMETPPSQGGGGVEPSAAPPSNIVVDFLDASGEDAIGYLQANSYPAALLAVLNQSIAASGGTNRIPQLELGQVVALGFGAGVTATRVSPDLITRPGHFAFIFVNQAQTRAFGSVLVCGFRTPLARRAVMITTQCLERAQTDAYSDRLNVAQLARTMTHEFGHWLGLAHVFSSASEDESMCSLDDGIADTPRHTRPAPVSGDGCGPPPVCAGDEGLQNPFYNVMSYAKCYPQTFTAGQIEAMQRFWRQEYVWLGFSAG